ncbi:MAG: hypothetical protein P4L36_04950 [Holophaga sp.]|nr:hypothetical protein [Holophaga sp.]
MFLRLPFKLSWARIALCLAHVPALAGVQVEPRRATLTPGGICAFKASEDGVPSGAGWSWSLVSGPGEIDARTGVYRAPPLQAAGTARVRAALEADPDIRGEASIVLLPLPANPFDLVTQVLGHGWVEPFPGGLPFLDLGTGQRMTLEAIHDSAWVRAPRIWAGCGIPFTLTWEPVPGAQTLLSYQEGGELIRRDVTGQASQVIVPRGQIHQCRVESLRRTPGGGWSSRAQVAQVEVRGLFPFSGNPVAGAGHQDGVGLAARFTQPFGVVNVPGDPDAGVALLVTDRRAHLVRTVTLEGKAATLCGEPGMAGHRDSPSWPQKLCSLVCGVPPPRPLFHSPTYLDIRTPPGPDGAWEAVVADSGNHVLRLVKSDGTVSTLAGTPCRAGYRDSNDPALAAFHDPQGLAVDPVDQKLYVADRGNRVIRIVDPGGRVSTLAGNPRSAGSLDGVGSQASFTDLKALCLPWTDDHQKHLYVLDGHALRRVTLPGGAVTTVLGVVDQPGWREILAEDGPDAARQPCLNHPTGLLPFKGGLFIADHGNHAVRAAAFQGQVLFTKAGSPAAGGRTRWGLLPDRLKAPLDEAYGALDGPWTLAYALRPGEHSPPLVVTTGPCLGEIHHAGEATDDLAIADPRAFRPAEGGPLTVRFATRVTDQAGHPVQRALHYTVDFLDAGGELAAKIQGHATSGGTIEARAGQAWLEAESVVIRCVTDQGWSNGGTFRVAPDEPGLAVQEPS